MNLVKALWATLCFMFVFLLAAQFAAAIAYIFAQTLLWGFLPEQTEMSYLRAISIFIADGVIMLTLIIFRFDIRKSIDGIDHPLQSDQVA